MKSDVRLVGGVRGGLRAGLLCVTCLAGGSSLAGTLSAQESIEVAADAFVRQWAGGDLDQIGDALHADGVRVSIGGERANLVSVRQALAALREFHGGHEAGDARVSKAAEVGGVPLRAFAEVGWVASPLGTSEPAEYMIFVGFIREDEAWRITEIRVFP